MEYPSSLIEGTPPKDFAICYPALREETQNALIHWIAHNIEFVPFKNGNKREKFGLASFSAPFPRPFQWVKEQIPRLGLGRQIFNNASVAHFEAEGGMFAHTDDEAYEDRTVVLSLKSHRILRIVDETGAQMRALLPPGSLYVMSGRWRHGISDGEFCGFKGVWYPQRERYSIAFGNIRPESTDRA